jgi:hypothetical protein
MRITDNLKFQFFFSFLIMTFLLVSFTRLKNLIKVKGVLTDVGVITHIVS